MTTLLNHLSVRNRIWAVVALLIGSIVVGGVMNVLTLREVMWREKEQKTRQLVESGFSVLAHFHALQTRGELTEAAAQAGAIGTIRAMRYDEKEYFWLTDLGQPFPKMVMHPTMPELEGQRMDAAQFNSAANGQKNLFVAFVDVVNQGGQGYVTYDWPKPMVGSGVTEQRYPKLSYVKKFAPWGWLIGSGVYVDDVDAAVRREGERNVLLVSGTGIVLLLFALLIARSIAKLAHRGETLEAQVAHRTVELRALLDATAESVLLLDPQGKILAINAFAAERFGQSPQDIAGKNFFALMPPDLADNRRAVMQQVLSTGQPQHSRDRRGAVFFDNSVYPVKDAAGAVESVAVFAKDVTEQHSAREVDDIFRKLDAVLLKWRMNLESIAQMFCEDILPVFDLAAAWIARAEKDGQLTLMASAEGSDKGLLSHLGAGGLRWDGEPACCLPAGAVVRSGHWKIVASDGPQCQTCNTHTPALHGRATIVLPLTLGGSTWGVLTLYGRDPHQFEGEQLPQRLAAIATRVGSALESALQQEWLTLLDAALAGVDNSVFITDARANILWVNRAFTQLSGFASGEILGKTPKLFSAGVQDADFYRHFWHTIQSGTTWRGDIVNARRDGSLYTVSQTVTPLRNTEGQVSHYVAILEDITQRRAEEERIQHSAHFDLLTDLPNRSLFFDRLGQALALGRRDGTPGALMFLDLDHFKEVNDQLGHAAGDSLLVAVANRLREQVRESDTVARLGGDEFTVILPSLRDGNDAVRVANNIIAAIGKPFHIAGAEARVGVSIGIALFPQHGDTVERILNAADNAMYRSKNAGRNCYTFASDDVAPTAVQGTP